MVNAGKYFIYGVYIYIYNYTSYIYRYISNICIYGSYGTVIAKKFSFATKNSSDSKSQALQLPDKRKNCHVLVPIEVIEFTGAFSHNRSAPKPT